MRLLKTHYPNSTFHSEWDAIDQQIAPKVVPVSHPRTPHNVQNVDEALKEQVAPKAVPVPHSITYSDVAAGRKSPVS